MIELTSELREALTKNGLALKPINRGPESIKDEPKWQLERLGDK